MTFAIELGDTKTVAAGETDGSNPALIGGTLELGGTFIFSHPVTRKESETIAVRATSETLTTDS